MRDTPPEIVKIIAANGLGEVVGRYRQTVLVEMSFVVTCGCIGLAGLLFGDGVGKALGATACGLAVLFAIPAWRKARKHLYLCAHGLLTTTGASTVTRVLTWDDVVGVRLWTTRIYQLGPVEEFQRCVLELHDGRRVNLAKPPYVRAEQLAASIERLVAAHNYPRRAAEIAETGATAFGPITVTAEGVRAGERFVNWSDITKMERGRVRLRIWTGAGRSAISQRVRSIPDVAVLTTLVSKSIERRTAR